LTIEPSITPVEGPIRVLIVDDHIIVRYGVRAYLAEDSGLLVVGDAEDGNDAVRQVRELRPDVVLMDLRMPRLDGIAATAMIRRETPTTEVVVLSAMLEASWVVSAVRAGAIGYLGKNSNESHLCQAVRRAKLGQVNLTSDVASTLMREMRALEVPEPLTDREMAVLKLLALGHSNQHISAELGISGRTVRAHVGHLLLKLGVERRSDLALRAMHLGVLAAHATAHAV
jgi:DNA-binding NarL/FixJ family response regulator